MTKSKRFKKADEQAGSSNIALIYCRVSSLSQQLNGHGLEGQEQRCREYAARKGYEVEEVFPDTYSGGGDFMLRPKMKKLLGYVDQRRDTNYIVIFDDLARFARDTVFHIQLRSAFKVRNIRPECLNYEFNDSEEGRFAETILAAGGQLQREQNRRQAIQKQEARLKAGYWSFCAPTGYEYTSDPLHGRIMAPDEKAPLIKEAFEGFANGRFASKADVARFFRDRRLNGGKTIYPYLVDRILFRSVYAGLIEYLPWKIEARKGHHEAIISLETYEKVQEKLGVVRTYKRSVEREEFPLRGLVVCAKCRHRLTAGWSKGRTKSYAYYRCQRLYCTERDVRKEVIEGKLHELLQELKPKEEAIRLVEAMCADVWGRREGERGSVIERYQRLLRSAQQEKEEVMERIMKAKSDSVMSALEDRITKVDESIEELKASIVVQESVSGSYGTMLGKVIDLLKDPVKTWDMGGYKGKRLITSLVFLENPVYDRELHYGTADLSTGIKLFEQFSTQKSLDVEVAGYDPASESCFESESTARS